MAERVRMLGSAAVDLAWTVEGKLDASITLSNKPWEMAAGVLIAREAGVQVFDWDGTPHGPGSSATVAVAGSLASSVLALVREAEQASRSATGSRPATGHR